MKPPLLGIMEHFRIVIPKSPKRATTISNGKVLNSWFDIKKRGPDTFKQPLTNSFEVSHIHESALLTKQVIEKELTLINENRIFIGGFS